MLYALSGLVGVSDPAAASASFWAAAHELHRAVTHALPVGLVAGAGFGAWRARSRRPLLLAGGALLGGLLGVVWVASGPVAAAVLVPFLAGGVAVATVAERWGFGPRVVVLTALAGLLTHPFGDLVTGTPPPLLYPFDVPVFAGRVTLAADPTLHLLGAFFLELAVIWLAVLVFAHLRAVPLRAAVRPRALAGLGYAGVALVLPAPTLEVASPFVVSVLAVGLVGAPVGHGSGGGSRWWAGLVTALVAVTLAALAYAAVYVAL
jgi:hypothetical protein